MKRTPLVFFMTSMLLAGCGSDDSSSTGNAGDTDNTEPSGSNATATPPSFSEIMIPSGFNWEMQSSEVINFKHVSNISQIDGVPLNIAGEYYVEIYSIDENNNTSATPFLKTMTTGNGEARVLLTLLNSWKGITVKTQLKDSVCTNTLLKEQITATQAIGCDVVLESEQL